MSANINELSTEALAKVVYKSGVQIMIPHLKDFMDGALNYLKPVFTRVLNKIEANGAPVESVKKFLVDALNDCQKAASHLYGNNENHIRQRLLQANVPIYLYQDMHRLMHLFGREILKRFFLDWANTSSDAMTDEMTVNATTSYDRSNHSSQSSAMETSSSAVQMVQVQNRKPSENGETKKTIDTKDTYKIYETQETKKLHEPKPLTFKYTKCKKQQTDHQQNGQHAQNGHHGQNGQQFVQQQTLHQYHGKKRKSDDVDQANENGTTVNRSVKQKTVHQDPTPQENVNQYIGKKRKNDDVDQAGGNGTAENTSVKRIKVKK